MSSREGGKQKPLKAPKAAPKDLSPEDLAFKAKQAAEKKAIADAAAKLKGKK